MSLFDTDIVEKDVKVSVPMKFAVSLSTMIKNNHRGLISSMRTHGIKSVMSCIEGYVKQLKFREEYSKFLVTGRDTLIAGEYHNYQYCTHIKNEIYIVVKFCRADNPWRIQVDKSEVIIILDRYLREIKFKVREF